MSCGGGDDGGGGGGVEGGGAVDVGVTVTEAVECPDPAVAVMTAEPGLPPATSPDDATLATDGLLLVQVI